MMDEENEVIINDQSENGQKQTKQSNNTSNGNCFMAHLGLWVAIIALALNFMGMFLSICTAYTAGTIFSWLSITTVFAAIVIECLKYLKTKQLNIKGDLFFVVVIAVILCI